MQNIARSDPQIRQSVLDELEWSPDVHATDIGVVLENGVVTLSGEVGDGFERRAVVRAALRTRGVTTVMDALVESPSSSSVTDDEITKRVTDALGVLTTLPGSVRGAADDHTVTLTGEVEWHYQRENARRAVENITGVSRVVNAITLHPRASALDTDQRIRAALMRNAMLDADGITVTVSGSTATLTGHVHSFAERSQAEEAAWSSPHVMDVRDYLTVTG